MPTTDSEPSQLTNKDRGGVVVESEVEAKGGTDKPANMPIVLLVSTVGAAIAMWVIWSVFFAQG